MAAGGGGGTPHFRLYRTEFDRLLSHPMEITEKPGGALDPTVMTDMVDAIRERGKDSFYDLSKHQLHRNIRSLRKYIAVEPTLEGLSDQEKIDFFKTIKPNSCDFYTSFNKYALGGTDIIDIVKNRQIDAVDKILNRLLDFDKPPISVPILIKNIHFADPSQTGGHAIVVSRHGSNIEIYDPSAFPIDAYGKKFADAYQKFKTLLDYEAASFGGKLIESHIFHNPHGFCDTMSCVRAYHKDLPLEEFMKRFVVPGYDQRSHDYLLREYYQQKIPKIMFIKNIKTFEPHVAKIERHEMGEEDILSRRMKPAYAKEDRLAAQYSKREKPKFKMSDLFKSKDE